MNRERVKQEHIQANDGENIHKILKPYVKTALKTGVTDAVIIKTANVITAPWVILKCRFGCAGYANYLCCPPYSPTCDEMRRILDSYRHAILLHRHVEKGWKAVEELNQASISLERTLFLDGYYKAWATNCGPCNRCKECDTSDTCRHPDEARPSMEACGIDVYATARGYGLPIDVVRSRTNERDFYTLVLVE
jgi:predicted metal-binding protein